MNQVSVRVVKIGGSLFDLSDLSARIEFWLRHQSPATNVLIAGGGELADAVRTADQRHHLGELEAHWMCVDCMSVTARMLSVMLPNADLIASYDKLVPVVRQGLRTVVFDVGSFLRQLEAELPGQSLPHGWMVTSDSIAARVASTLSADELVLAKSREPPTECNSHETAHGRYFDEVFPQFAAAVGHVRFVNLRDDAWVQTGERQ